MALRAAIIMSVVSIIMLVMYGIDVVLSSPTGKGFLHMDVTQRGSIFGIIPSAMLIISYFITRRESSTKLGALIIAGGALIIVGTGIILVLQGSTVDGRGIREFGAVLVIGIVITILGGLKIKKSR